MYLLAFIIYYLFKTTKIFTKYKLSIFNDIYYLLFIKLKSLIEYKQHTWLLLIFIELMIWWFILI